MLITKRSTLSGVEHTKEVAITPEQLRSWEEGMLIQQAMPDLDAKERDFIKFGFTDEEWDELYLNPNE